MKELLGILGDLCEGSSAHAAQVGIPELNLQSTGLSDVLGH